VGGQPQSLIDPADRLLLSSVQIALETPFRDPVRVAGQLMPRKLARQIERSLLRLRVLERTTPPAAAVNHSSAATCPGSRLETGAGVAVGGAFHTNGVSHA
jgi:hypothetical protein